MTGERADDAAATLHDFRKNLVVAASAGTGKTHALVGVAVHLLMGACRSGQVGLRPPIAPAALIATTFSRKAAGEIRERLRRELGRLADGDPEAAYRKDLLAACARAEVPAFTDVELATRARQALGGLFRAQIGTLHGIAGTLLRENALAARLSPDFVVADEETSHLRARDAIAKVLEREATTDEVPHLIRLAGGIRGAGGAAREVARPHG